MLYSSVGVRKGICLDLDIGVIVENQMEKQMENALEITEVLQAVL